MRVGLVIPYTLSPGLSERITRGEHPSMEILQLASKLKADIIDSTSPLHRNLLVRWAVRANKSLGIALVAWLRRKEFDVYYLAGEREGLLLGALLRWTRRRPRMVVVNHYLSNPKKARLFKLLRLDYTIDAFICLNRFQAKFIESNHIASAEKAFLVKYGGVVDGSFFQSAGGNPNVHRYVLSVGRESRDYVTLFSALKMLGCHAKIVSSGVRDPNEYAKRPPGTGACGIEVLDYVPYVELRNLYDQCEFVVISVRNVEYPAGITSIMEAMSMGKAVIATASVGIEEYIEDGVTGFWTASGDAAQLRDRMALLWNNPELARRMGENAREWVKTQVNMGRYVNELATIISKVGDHSTEISA